MDFNILYAIQGIRTPVLDQIILAITNIMGSYGQISLIVAACLLALKKTRKAGFCVLLAYILVLLFGHVLLKDIIARPRPCHIDETIKLLVTRPNSFSCPSTHTAWAFAAATSIFLYFKKAGIFALVIAAIMGFSRMYLFVHFPTDVLAGIVMGVVVAVVSKMIVEAAYKRKKAADKKSD